jgi:hypothetical protein
VSIDATNFLVAWRSTTLWLTRWKLSMLQESPKEAFNFWTIALSKAYDTAKVMAAA